MCQQDDVENGPVTEISLDYLIGQASQVDNSGTQAPTERWQASGKLMFCLQILRKITETVRACVCPSQAIPRKLLKSSSSNLAQ